MHVDKPRKYCPLSRRVQDKVLHWKRPCLETKHQTRKLMQKLEQLKMLLNQQKRWRRRRRRIERHLLQPPSTSNHFDTAHIAGNGRRRRELNSWSTNSNLFIFETSFIFETTSVIVLYIYVWSDVLHQPTWHCPLWHVHNVPDKYLKESKIINHYYLLEKTIIISGHNIILKIEFSCCNFIIF